MRESAAGSQATAVRGKSGTSVEETPTAERSIARRLRILGWREIEH